MTWRNPVPTIEVPRHFRTYLPRQSLCLGAENAFIRISGIRKIVRDQSGSYNFHLPGINPAKNLSPFLQTLPKHALHSFPQLDMPRMSFADSSIDVILHSDTLEHVPDPKAALKESMRVLKPDGHLFLYRSNRHWPIDPDTVGFASKLSRKTGSEPGRLRGTNRIRPISGARFSRPASAK